MTLTASKVLGPNSPFPNLSITVNQTRNLTTQAVSVTWSGGTPTNSDVPSQLGKFYDNYLQIFQCWSKDAGTSATYPGPSSPTGCVYGGDELLSAYNGGGNGILGPNLTRGTGANVVPFQPADGSPAVVSDTASVNDPNNPNGVIWANTFFDQNTTNEIVGAQTHSDGTGSEHFTVDSGFDASGLGCGEQVAQPDGTSLSPRCWLVVVPRGTPLQEDGVAGQIVQSSPLAPNAWAHRIAFPLDFNPVTSCPLQSLERKIAGGELAASAASSWQGTLCSRAGSTPYQYSAISDDEARSQLQTGGAFGGTGMAITSQAIDPATADPASPVLYAPLTLSGVSIAFNIERAVGPSYLKGPENVLTGLGVQNLYLTPRLVAKLLTESYQNQFDLFVLAPPDLAASHAWAARNPVSLVADPDFLQFNPEFRALTCGSGTFECGGLVVEQPTSDAAQVLWAWVLADPEARAWLDGTPAFGMNVNPYYSIKSSLNPGGTPFGTPVPNTFPKSDPYTYQDKNPLVGGDLPRPLSMQDFLPYTATMQSAAIETRNGSVGSKTLLNTGALTADQAWKSTDPELPNSRFVLSVTDSVSAAQYGLQTAKLSRAGDDGQSRSFVAADTAGLEAGQQWMVPSAVPGVLQINPTGQSAASYPLTVVNYGQVMPAALDAPACKDYAAFINYGAGPGQTPGVQPGQLPPGYAPLPPSLVAQATATAQSIMAKCGPPPAPASTPQVATTAPPSASSLSTSGTTTPASSAPSSGTPASSTPAPSAATASAPTVPPTAKAPTPPAVTAPLQVASPASTGKTLGPSLGVVRYALPAVGGLGVLAALGARWLSIFRRRPGGGVAVPS